jgi:hypothetical protein
MSGSWEVLSQSLQVFFAFLALIIAPERIAKLIGRFRAHVVVTCVPFRISPDGDAIFWRLIFRNNSRSFGGFTVHVIGERQGTEVTGERLLTLCDSGLKLEGRLEDGAALFNFQRFHRSRAVTALVQFSAPDVPAFYCPAGPVYAKLSRFPRNAQSVPHQLSLTRQRVKIFLLVFASYYLAICGRLIYAAVNHS